MAKQTQTEKPQNPADQPNDEQAKSSNHPHDTENIYHEEGCERLAQDLAKDDPVARRILYPNP